MRKIMGQPTVSAGMAVGLVNFVEGAGIDLSTPEFSPFSAELMRSDPDARVPLSSYAGLMQQAAEALGDPALHLKFAEQVSISKMSVTGLIMEASETMQEAFEQLQRYARLVMDHGTGIDGPRFEIAERGASQYLVDKVPPSLTHSGAVETSFVWLACGPRRFLNQPHILSVHFTHPRPASAAEAERIFDCPVHYDAPWNALELVPGIGELIVSGGQRYVFDLLAERATKNLAALNADVSVRGRVEAVLDKHLHKGIVSADWVSNTLQMSRQTLFRKLKQEGTSFTRLCEAFRRARAEAYLREHHVSSNEIAYLVGFSDPAAFTRAFKRWTGQTPGAFRRSTATQAGLTSKV